jgi:hypothetical protein
MTARLQNQEVAEELHDWFCSIQRLADRGLFSIAPDGPHGDAVILDVLVRNARTLAESRINGEGELYSPLCFFLAAACRHLRTSLGVGHWRAAVDNVVHFQEQMRGVQADSVNLGLKLGTTVEVFKQELDEAMNHAGLGGTPGYLDKENRGIALGLAVNWGIRFLLAYAIECGRRPVEPGAKDLTWVASLIAPLLVASAPESR